MPDDDVPRDRAGNAGAANGELSQPDGGRAFDLSSLFAHREDDIPAVRPEDVSALFAGLHSSVLPSEGTSAALQVGDSSSDGPEPSEPITDAPSPEDSREPIENADPRLHAPATLIDSAEGHLFDDAAAVSHPYTHAFPAPVPARPEPQHAAPRHGLRRPQVIAMGVGLVVTALGAGWALATPAAPVPVAVSATPTPTVDPARLAHIDGAIDSLAGEVKAAQTSADSFAAPLTAMSGASDEAARLAAEAARQAYVAALAAVKVPEPPGKSTTNAQLDALEREIASKQASLAAATAGFRGAITTFRQSLPGYAAAAVAENADAAEPFRTAVTDTAAAVASSDSFGAMPFATWDAWRNALAALTADQARAVAEARANDSGDGDTGSGDGTATEPATPPPATNTEPPSPVTPSTSPSTTP